VAGLNRAIHEHTLKQLADVRCEGCRRLLGRMSDAGLRVGMVLEIKCPKCDFFRYVVGESS
jgi:phage FluMu protein Com